MNPAPRTTSKEIPARIGKYNLLKLLATGGMGEVFLARMDGPAGFAKTVVVKRILPHLARDPAFVQMFLDEARLAATLTHPNITQIFELGEEAGDYYIAMEYIHGRSLRAIKQRLAERKERFPHPIAARICSLALQGLHYAHQLKDERGSLLRIVHRDVSPDNVLVGFNGEVKLVDFGIAKAAIGASTTRTGTVKGKYAYMAPEQILGERDIDGRVDVYSTGVVLYELLTGARPFTATTEPALIQAVLTNAPAPPRDRDPNISPRLEGILLRSLEKLAGDRYNTAEDMSLELDAYIHETGTVGSAQIASWVRSIFPPEDAEMNPVVLTPRSNPLAPSPEFPQSRPDTPGRVTMAVPVEVSISTVTRGPTRRKAVLAAVGLGVVAVATGALLALSRKSTPPPVTATPAPAPAQPSTGAPAPSQPPPAAAVPTPPPPDPAPAAEPAKPAPPASSRTRDRVVDRRRRPPPKTVEKEPAPVAMGGVDLRVNPWAEVFREGKSLGVTPLPIIQVPAGKHRFVLKNSELGLERQITVDVPPNGEAVVKIDLLSQ